MSQFNYFTGKEVCKECNDADQLHGSDLCLPCLRQAYRDNPQSFTAKGIAEIKKNILIDAAAV